MENLTDEVQEFALGNMRLKGDVPKFLATISRISIATVVQWEDRLRLGGDTFQFRSVKAARRMCDLLVEHFKAKGIPVHLSCQD